MVSWKRRARRERVRLAQRRHVVTVELTHEGTRVGPPVPDRRAAGPPGVTDKPDARHLRSLVADGRVPLSWIPPGQVLELRVLLQLYRDLAEEHTAWSQRIHATLFHQGCPPGRTG